MKTKLIIFIFAFSLTVAAQTPIEKSIVVKSGQKLDISLDDPVLSVQTWDKNEVLIKGVVNINRGENDNAFELQIEVTNEKIRIASILRDKEKIPQRIMIKKGETEYFFKAKDFNDPEVQKFLEANGHEYAYMSNGIVKDIKLEIFVPKKTETHIVAKYGLVEVKNFDGPLSIDAKYGGVDASLSTRSLGEITARTHYGEILTNLDIKFDQTRFTSKGNGWTEITAKPGTGPRAWFESKYGNVYLRKSN